MADLGSPSQVCNGLEMSTPTDIYEVRNLQNVFSQVNQQSMLEDIIKRYPSMACKRTKSSVLAKQGFDSIQMNSYKPAAKMVAFKTTNQQMPFWLLSLVG